MNVILPIDRKFLCQHRNGDTFATNPTTDFVPYMQGLVIEKLKVVSQYEVSTITEASTTVLIKASSGIFSGIKITHPFNTWNEEGFVVGNTIRIEANGNNTTETVNNIVGNDMYITDTAFFATLGVTDGDLRDDYVLKVTTVPDQIAFAFGLVPNSQAQNTFASMLNGETQLYTGTGLSGAPTTLTYLPNPATNLGSVDVTYDGASGTGNYIFTFTIAHIFRFPHFIPDWLTNYLNGTIPPAFQGQASFRYAAFMNFSVNINNPNEGKVFEDGFQLGSIGFVGQNFNNGAVDYSLSSSVIDISGTTVTKPEVTDVNSFTVTIARDSAAFANGVKAYLYISKLPDQLEIVDQSNDYETNFVMDQLDVLEGAGASSSTIIQNFDANKDGGDPSLLDLTFDIDWTGAQELQFEDGDNIYIGVIIEDGTLSATASDRMPVKIYAGQVTKNTDVPGQITNNQIDIYGSGVDIPLAVAVTDVDTWNNRAYILNGSFRVTKAANSNDSIIKAFKVQVVARKPGTTTFFRLNEYVFPFPGKLAVVNVDGTGYQAINLDTNRPLGNVPAEADLRKVKFSSVIPGAFQIYQDFTWELGIEIPWREWILNQQVELIAPEFYDSAEDQNNFNERSSNYSGLEGYEIFIFATATIVTAGIETIYHMSSDQSAVSDFDVDVIGTGWSAVTKYYDTVGQEIDVPYAGEDCHVEVTVTHPVGLLSDPAGEIVFEYSGETGQDHRLSSTKDWSGPNNALKPLAGETMVKLTQPTTTTVVIECLIKGGFLFDGVSINTYGHLEAGR